MNSTHSQRPSTASQHRHSILTSAHKSTKGSLHSSNPSQRNVYAGRVPQHLVYRKSSQKLHKEAPAYGGAVSPAFGVSRRQQKKQEGKKVNISVLEDEPTQSQTFQAGNPDGRHSSSLLNIGD